VIDKPSFNFPTAEDFIEGQLLLIDKPIDWTSFQVVNYLRSRLRRYTAQKKIKVGHAGTLDPLASGLLLVCTGKMTKRIEEFMGLKKVYTGSIQLGAFRPSFDMETEVTETWPTSHITAGDILEAMKKLSGKIQQVPPVYSAIRKDGKRLYELARAGESVDIEEKVRTVEIERFELLHFSPEKAEVKFNVLCSKGTYIRSLAKDLGKHLNNGAYLSSLRRENIGDLSVQDALEPKIWGDQYQEVFNSLTGRDKSE
jgi:tRNA pseudouridine55 synthase